jgi:hypothetical protein
MRHFLKFSELAPNVSPKSKFNTRTPAPKAASRDSIAKDQVPARLVTVAWRSLCAGAKPMNLAVEMYLIWRFKPRSTHGINELRFGGSD